MKLFVQKVLGKMARAVLKRRKPFVIGITGSLGKTTTKDVLFAILTRYTHVRTNIANYNNEFGVPLTVIGAPSGKRSLIGWLRVVVTWLWAMTVQRDYPTVLVLELGIDHKGDMDYLIDIVAPQMGVVTVVDGVHAQKMGSIATIAKEKGRLIARLPSDGVAILNADDRRVAKMSNTTDARVITYSAIGDTTATLWASNYAINDCGGLTFKLNETQTSVPIRMPHIIGLQLLPSIMAAIAVARAYGIHLVDIAQALTDVRPPKRRMNVHYMANGMVVIDDTAAPASMRGALVTLGAFPLSHARARRIAVLGDMRELGKVERKAHESLARDIVENSIDVVICVGPVMRYLYDVLVSTHHHQSIVLQHYATTYDAVQAIERIVTPGDIVLCKGSNGMHLWDVVEVLIKM